MCSCWQNIFSVSIVQIIRFDQKNVLTVIQIWNFWKKYKYTILNNRYESRGFYVIGKLDKNDF